MATWTRLKELLADANTTQIALAEHLGVTPGAINSYIMGRANPPHNRVLQIADFLGVPEYELQAPQGYVRFPSAWADYCHPLANAHHQGTPEWVEERKNGIGASEVSTILGDNPWGSVIRLWDSKTDNQLTPEDVGSKAHWGSILEPYIRAEAEKLPLFEGETIKESDTVQSIKYPWLRYSPDGFIKQGKILIEFKTVNPYLYDTLWANNNVAPHAYDQVQTGMLVTGARVAYVIVWHDREIDVRIVHFDEKIAEEIVEKTSAFWNCVETKTMPEVDASDSTTSALNELFPTSFGSEPELASAETADLVEQLKKKQQEKKDVDAEITRLKNAIRAEMGTASSLVYDGAKVAYWKQGRVNEKKLREEFSDVYSECTNEVVTSKLDLGKLKSEYPDAYNSARFLSLAFSK